MTSNRLYRQPMSSAEAQLEVERCQGTQFDPDVVHAFLAVIGVAQAVSA
jgi:HD-GYP domain-containing protein (c-di-GMP phosphodiesterase class II)